MNAPLKPEVFLAPDECRAERRFRIELPVLINTMRGDQKAFIIDVSRKGVKVYGLKVPPRSRVCIHYRRQYAEGTVRWVRPNGMIGIVLDAPLRTGPLGSVWKRFHENVEAFGRHKRSARPVFGRKSAE